MAADAPAGSALSADQWLADRLLAFLRLQRPSATELVLHDLTRSSSGKSRENWTFDACWQEGGTAHRLPLILRRDPIDSVLRTNRRTEFEVLKALQGGAVPVPPVHHLDETGECFGRPSLIMERIEGRCEWTPLNDSRPLAQRLAQARRFLSLLVEVHATDWRARGLGAVLSDPGAQPGLAALRQWEAELRRVQIEPQPELEMVIAWLREHCALQAPTVLVHGDFKPGNLLLQGERIMALLDWETAHLGDPLEDLGWMLNPTRAREHQIAGHWEQAQIIDEYQRLSGRTVNPAQLNWWIVFANFKLAVIVLTGVQAFVAGGLDRAYLSPTWILRVLMRSLREA